MAPEEEDLDMYAPTLPPTPPGGWTLYNLPTDLPKHTELIRGTLVVSPQKSWHLVVIRMLEAALLRQVPETYAILREMAIRKSLRSAPEPDLSIIRAAAFGMDRSVYLPEDVVLVGEVISPESEERDREDKSFIYAKMGIPTYWVVERGKDDAPIVHEHRLVEGEYRLVRTHVDRLTTDTPFAIDISLGTPTSGRPS